MTRRKIDYWVIPPETDGEFVASMEEVLAGGVLSRSAAAAAEVFTRLKVTHARPPFEIPSVISQGKEYAITEEKVVSTPFGTLLRFRKEGGSRAGESRGFRTRWGENRRALGTPGSERWGTRRTTRRSVSQARRSPGPVMITTWPRDDQDLAP